MRKSDADKGKIDLLLAVVGPTASGKSSLALKAAQILEAEIVNCDSMQLYRRLEIGTAKPSQLQRRLVPHHLYDIIDPHEYFSAGRYMFLGRRICRGIAKRGRVPLLVGGTGLYLRALLEGLFPGPGRSEEIRRRLNETSRRKGLLYLHHLLAARDPKAARRIQPTDRIRIVRALEVCFSTGVMISELHKRRRSLSGFSVLKVGLNLPSPVLHDRIDRRVRAMFRSGLIKEVERLLSGGVSREAKAFEALGYRHVAAFLSGRLSRAEALERMCRDTRRYAKRQVTWFRKEKDIRWIPFPGEDPAALKRLLQLFEEARENLI